MSQPLQSLGDLPTRKRGGPPLAVLTAYDFGSARLLDEAGVDLLLVGDSLGMVVHGLPDTTGVTLEMMLLHTRAVRRANPRAPVIADLPFATYATPQQALVSAQALMQAGADAVKLEGGRRVLAQVECLVAAGIAVCGHIGMLPQSILEEGAYRRKGRTQEQAQALLEDATALDQAGVVAMVLESVVDSVAAEITGAVGCSTIGIGSGPANDGQVLVTHDVIGAFPWFRPPFATARADCAAEIRRAAAAFVQAVHEG
jgi:3-methyl-2-oxobutanoate hydroxymethyltransferase